MELNIENITALTEQGYEIVEIAEKLGVSKRQLQRFKAKHPTIVYDKDKALFLKNKRRWEGESIHGNPVLEVVSYTRYGPCSIKYNARTSCTSCGKEFVAPLCSIQKKRNLTCGCARERKLESHPCWQGKGKVPKSFWRRVLDGAKARGYNVGVTHQEIADLFDEQQGLCAVTRLPLDFGTNRTGTASLDRIDNSLGYVKGNVQWVHRDINQMKFKYSMDRFLELCALVTENNKSDGIF